MKVLRVISKLHLLRQMISYIPRKPARVSARPMRNAMQLSALSTPILQRNLSKEPHAALFSYHDGWL